MGLVSYFLSVERGEQECQQKVKKGGLEIPWTSRIKVDLLLLVCE